MNNSLIEALQRLQVGNPFAVLEEPVMMLAFFLCVLGFMFNVLVEKEDRMRALGRCAVASVFIAALPFWSSLVRDGLYFLPYGLLDFHTSLTSTCRHITRAFVTALKNPAYDFSLFDALSNVLMDVAVAILMRIVATMGSLVAIPLLFLQVGVEKFLITTMPVAVAALTIPALRSQAQGYLAFWVSILLWPLFFAVVTVIAGLVFTVSNNLGELWADLGTGVGGIISVFIAPFAAGAILFGGIIATPPLAYSLATHGGAALSGPSVLGLTAHLRR